MNPPRTSAARHAAWTAGAQVGTLGESEVIERLRRRVGGAAGAGTPAVAIGIGDDCSLLRPRSGWDLLWTCDLQLEGGHFLPAWMSPVEVGARAAEVNLSDIAAMGGRPLAALVSLGLPATFRWGALEQIYEGIMAALGRHGAVIVGGNVARADRLWIDLTMIGEVEAGRALRRAGAKPGDLVWVTGYPGRAAAALAAIRTAPLKQEELIQRLRLAYAAPRARIGAGRYLVENAIATAAIDLSDGLAADLGHLCRESGATIVVEEDLLPVSTDLTRMAALLAVDPGRWVCGASDDYELLFTTARADADRALAMAGEIDAPVSLIGQVVAGPAKVLLSGPSPELTELTGGWDHLTAD